MKRLGIIAIAIALFVLAFAPAALAIPTESDSENCGTKGWLFARKDTPTSGPVWAEGNTLPQSTGRPDQRRPAPLTNR